MVRRQYWTTRSTVEVLTIIGIAWYLKMELFRTKQLPSRITTHSFEFCQKLKDDIMKEAAVVYNNVYRDSKSSEIVLIDTGRSDLDGRHGVIQGYDSVSLTYQVLLSPKKINSKRPGSILPMHAECMEPLHKLPIPTLDSTPNVFSRVAVIPNTFKDATAPEMSVSFRHDVLREVRKRYENPTLDSESAYAIMEAKLVDIDKVELEQRNEERQRQIMQQKALEDFISTHTPIHGHPPKRRRFHAPMPTQNRTCQMNALWDAKIDYIRNVVMPCSEDPHEHLFTYPFKTNDDSFVDCILDSPFWQDCNTRDNNVKDEVFSKRNGKEPIIITTSSIKSMAPGSDIEDNVLDLCLQWYVPGVFFLE